MKIKLKFKLFIIIFIIVVNSLFAVNRDENDVFNRAESYFYSKNYNLAKDCYSRFIKQFPLSDLVPDAYYKKAVCLYHLGRIEESLKIFNLVEKKYRVTKYYRYIPFWKGLIYYLLKDYTRSEENLDKFLMGEYIPELSPRALLYSALDNLALGDVETARNRLDVLVSKKGYAHLGPYENTIYSYVLLKSGSYKRLLEFLRNIDMSVLPDKYRNYIDFYKAEALWNLGRKPDAVKLYEKLLNSEEKISSASFVRLFSYYQSRGDSNSIDDLLIKTEDRFKGSKDLLVKIWLKVGVENYRSGNYKFAEYMFLKVFKYGEQSDFSGISLIYLSRLLMDKGEVKKAIELVKPNISRYKSENIKEYLTLYLGNLYLKSMDYKSALSVYRDFLINYPNSSYKFNVYLVMAFLEYKLGNYGEAVKYSRELIKGLKNSYSKDLAVQGLRIEAFSYKKLGRYDEALDAIDRILNIEGNEENLVLDKIKILFQKRDFDSVLRVGDKIFNEDIVKAPKNLQLLKYLYGLSLVVTGNYQKAVSILGDIDYNSLKNAGLDEIYPYTLYYLGWAYYKLGNFNMAIKSFKSVNDSNRRLYARSTLMSGWCYYQMSSYLKAAGEFLLASKISEGDEKVKDIYLAAKSYQNAGEYEKAAGIYREIIEQYEGATYWDDAVFEYSNILVDQGKVKDAAYNLLLLYEKAPDSPLVDEALYRRGEILYNSGMYSMASEAFRLYIEKIKKGNMVDAALFWYGMSRLKLGDGKGAVILWEKIIKKYPGSSYRPDALLKIADYYAENGEYNKSLLYYGKLIDEYPDFAKKRDVAIKREKVRYILFGLTKKEAELTAIISIDGEKSNRGRMAMLELSEHYINSNKKLELAYQYLNRVAEYGTKKQIAEAMFLFGKYYEMRGDYLLAAKSFFKAAAGFKNDKNKFGKSLYLSALMMKRANRIKEMKAIVKKMEESIPGSKWTKMAKDLLKKERLKKE